MNLKSKIYLASAIVSACYTFYQPESQIARLESEPRSIPAIVETLSQAEKYKAGLLEQVTNTLPYKSERLSLAFPNEEKEAKMKKEELGLKVKLLEQDIDDMENNPEFVQYQTNHAKEVDNMRMKVLGGLGVFVLSWSLFTQSLTSTLRKK